MIQLYNRATGQMEAEQVAQENFLEFLYTTLPGKLFLSLFFKRKGYSDFLGFLCRLRLSRRSIGPFIREFNIPVEEMACAPSDYACFNDFFIRKLKPGARVFDSDVGTLISPADSRLSAWQKIGQDSSFPIKGLNYSITALTQSPEVGEKYRNGSCLVFRLAPVDYHRFHFVDSGIPQTTLSLKGNYYSVNPLALRNIPGVFGKNARALTTLKSDHFGDILYVEVGATGVGSIQQTFAPGRQVAKGDEKGYFQFGGSTVVLFFEENRIRIDEDILSQTQIGVEARVKAGERVGCLYSG